MGPDDKQEQEHGCDQTDAFLKDILHMLEETGRSASENEERAKKTCGNFMNAAIKLYSMYEMLMEAGFTEQQAFKLVYGLIGGKLA